MYIFTIFIAYHIPGHAALLPALQQRLQHAGAGAAPGRRWQYVTDGQAKAKFWLPTQSAATIPSQSNGHEVGIRRGLVLGSLFPIQIKMDQRVVTKSLKGQVTFLKLCLLVVCLALSIPRFTLFFFLLKSVFRPKNAFDQCQAH